MTPAARARILATIADLQALLDADCDCPEADATTVAELWARYIETMPRGERWVASAVSTMKPMMAKIGHLRVGELKIAHIEDYRDEQEIRDRYSVGTLNAQARRAKALMNWALDSGRISANPLQRLKQLRDKPNRETEITHEGEAAALALMDRMMQAFFLVAIDSAMRRDEIRLLEWREIDWSTKKIRIPASKTKARRERIGRLTTRAALAIKTLPRVPGSPYVFANPETKEPWSQSYIWLRWRTAADGAKLKPAACDDSVRLHDARASAASRLVRAGATMPAIQQILGHAHLSTTARYVRVQGKDVDEAHALLEAHIILAAARKKGPQRAPTRAAKVSMKSSRASG